MCTVSTTAKAATSKSCDRHVSKHDQAWHHRFKQLVQYKQFHGNTFVPLRFKPNPPLGRWVNRQREALNKKNLSWEREEMLNEIGKENSISRVNHLLKPYKELTFLFLAHWFRICLESKFCISICCLERSLRAACYLQEWIRSHKCASELHWRQVQRTWRLG